MNNSSRQPAEHAACHGRAIAKEASRMIGGACGLPERGKRATGASRFYRVTATPGALFVKWRDSLRVPRTCDPWTGSAAPDNSSRSPRDARKPVHFFHCAGKGTCLAAQKLEDVSEFR